MSETFGEEVKWRRLAIAPKVSQTKLAELADVSPKVISDMERGSRDDFKPGIRRLVSNALDDLEVRAKRASRQSDRSQEAKRSSEFGEWLGVTSKALGFKNNSAFARAIGVNQANVSRWSNGQSIPTVDHLVKMSDLFGIDLKTLLAMSGHITPEQANRSESAPLPRPVLPEGAIAASIEDVMTVLRGPLGDPEAYMTAVKRLHLACLPDAEIVEEEDQ